MRQEPLHFVNLITARDAGVPACGEHTLEYLDMTVILGVWSQSLAVIIIAFPLGRHIASEAKFLILHLDDRTWFKRADCVHYKLTQRCTEPVPTFVTCCVRWTNVARTSVHCKFANCSTSLCWTYIGVSGHDCHSGRLVTKSGCHHHCFPVGKAHV